MTLSISASSDSRIGPCRATTPSADSWLRGQAGPAGEGVEPPRQLADHRAQAGRGVGIEWRDHGGRRQRGGHGSSIDSCLLACKLFGVRRPRAWGINGVRFRSGSSSAARGLPPPGRRAAARAADACPTDAPVRLRKSRKTSNLFRSRDAAHSRPRRRRVHRRPRRRRRQPHRRRAGMTTYEHLVDATLPYGLMPLVVPQLKTITLGGAVTGLGIESTSFRNGCPHESVLEMDVLTGDGRVVTASPRRRAPRPVLRLPQLLRHARLRAAAADRARAGARRTSTSRHLRFDDACRPFARRSTEVCADRRVGRRAGRLRRRHRVQPRTSATSRSARFAADRAVRHRTTPGSRSTTARSSSRSEDYLTIRDYLWRWDTDWFWCSRAFGVQNPADPPARADALAALRRLLEGGRLRAPLPASSGAHRRPARQARREELVIQDVEVPVDRLAEFLDFFHREVGIEPVWMCPLRQRDPDVTLGPRTRSTRRRSYVNVGFWSTVPLPPGRARRLPQPADRGEGRRARRPQVAVLHRVLRRG